MSDDYRYTMLTLTEREAMLSDTLIAQERDYFVHTLNAERFELILADTALDHNSEFAKRIQELLRETLQRRAEVKIILSAVHMQVNGTIHA